MGYKSIAAQRLGEIRLNKNGTPMKIIQYNTNKDITVEFQDKYCAKVHTRYSFFLNGTVRNPYDKVMYGVGIVGNKYKTNTKEYNAWSNILQRCYSNEWSEKYPTYNNATCCEEWLLYENFYEWITSRENYNLWLSNNRWCVDKDILIKGNKHYSPSTCVLVSGHINRLFTKNDKHRGDLPIGVVKKDGKYYVSCNDPIKNKQEFIGYTDSPEKGFLLYKKRKEDIIKQVAKIEFNKGNITKNCYEAMMKYEVEITD